MNVVKFNVGGQRFETSRGTIEKYETMLKNLVKYSKNESAEDEDQTLTAKTSVDGDGYIVIDRDGRNFHYVLNFLRDGSVALPNSIVAVQEIIAEANFYSFPELSTACEQKFNALYERDFWRFNRCVYAKDELDIMIESKEALAVMSYNLENKFASERTRSRFYDFITFFNEMRLVYPGFYFITNLSTKTGNFFKLDFYHNGKLLTSLKTASTPNDNYTTNPSFEENYKYKFTEAIVLLLGSVASFLDPDDTVYISSEHKLCK